MLPIHAKQRSYHCQHSTGPRMFVKVTLPGLFLLTPDAAEGSVEGMLAPARYRKAIT